MCSAHPYGLVFSVFHPFTRPRITGSQCTRCQNTPVPAVPAASSPLFWTRSHRDFTVPSLMPALPPPATLAPGTFIISFHLFQAYVIWTSDLSSSCLRTPLPNILKAFLHTPLFLLHPF